MKRTRLEIAVFYDGRTSRDIAKAAGLSPSHFSQMLRGKRRPRITTAMRLADVLKADVAELFNGE